MSKGGLHPRMRPTSSMKILVDGEAALMAFAEAIDSPMTPCAESIRGLAQPFQPVVEAPLA